MGNNPQYTISIIICTFNRATALDNCLASLTKQTYSNFEIIIVDGGSSDKTNIVINKYSQKLKINKLIFITTSLAQTRQFGLLNTTGKYVSYIDDDVIVSPDWAKSIVETFKKNKDIGGISGPTIVPTNLIKNRDVFFFHQNKNILTRFYTNFFLEGQPYAVGKIFKCGAWSPGSNFPSCLRIKKLQEVDYLEACNMTLRRDLIFEVDGFDLNYTQTSEWCELDLAIRVKKLGYQLVFNPRVMVKHYLSRQGTFTKRNASLHRLTNFLRFYFRHVFKFSLSYILRFSSYLFFLFSYWLYKTHMKTTYGWQK